MVPSNGMSRRPDHAPKEIDNHQQTMLPDKLWIKRQSEEVKPTINDLI